MRKMKLVIYLVVIGAAILFVGNNDLYAGGGTCPWPLSTPKRGSTTWTATLVITGEIVNVPGLPAPYLPDPPTIGPCDIFSGTYGTPTSISTYKDLLLKVHFFVRLGNSKQGYEAFSGLARDNQGFYFFYALGDYANGRIGEALVRFLTEKVSPYLPGAPYSNLVLTNVFNSVTNVETQLRIGNYGRESLQPETPLYYNADITFSTW